MGDILIEQNLIRESFYADPKDSFVRGSLNCIDLDEIVRQQFGCQCEQKTVLNMFIKDIDNVMLKTGVVPVVKDVPLDECRTIDGIISARMRRFGLVAVHFAGNRIQYLLDIAKLIGSVTE